MRSFEFCLIDTEISVGDKEDKYIPQMLRVSGKGK
jgi:hypothetical protein